MLHKTLLTAVAVLLALATAVPSGAEAEVSATATRSGSTVTVSGHATFAPNDGPFEVGGALTGFAHAGAGDALGINLTKAEVEVLEDGVRFIWHVNELGEQVPPEVIRYTWAFGAGGQSFQLQAKRTNLVSVTTTEDPVGHAQHATTGDDWFQLRGACQTSYQGLPSSGCFHLAFLDGAFDADANTISMFMPFNARDKIGRLVGEGFVRGAEILPQETASSSITATVQAGVSTTASESYINGWNSFFAGEAVQAFVGTATQTAPSFGQEWQSLTVAEDGTFSGTLTGATAQQDTVHVRACNLDVCATTAVTL